MKIKEDKLCSYCGKNDETILHLFFHCDLAKSLWQTLRTKISTLPELTPQSAFFGLHTEHMCINHIHLIFRIALYKNRHKKTCNVNTIVHKIKMVKAIEDHVTFYNEDAKAKNTAKWAIIQAYDIL